MRSNNLQGILECVPNFSEGRDVSIIKEIKKNIERVKGVKVLHTDMGYDTNRTVITFAGEPNSVIEAAFNAVKSASKLIDMSLHKGAHPRVGATDVLPLVPIRNISIEQAVELSYKLANKIGEELQISVYCYEKSARLPERIKLENIRKGGYEGLPLKIANPLWKPDFGPAIFNSKSGATIIGARNILIAFNVNLDTKSVEIASQIASIIRESGRIITDGTGNSKRIPGMLPGVKAIGWGIEEYKKAQVSMNLTNIKLTSLHEAFETVKKVAEEFGVKVTGSELIGIAPLIAFIEAGKYYNNGNKEVSENDLINLAIEKLGLNEIKPFDPKKRIIEYLLKKSV
jgi:glutamate formiminotransferase/formiminotetrahydrofolate cyclodeaminase